MARRSSGSVLWIGILFVIGLIASIPKEVWVLFGVFALLGLGFYLLSLVKPSSSTLTSSRFGSSDDLPTDPSVTSSSCWIPPCKEAVVDGVKVSGGMLYIGKGLASVASNGIEPALINTALKVSAPVGTVEQLDYWPSYSSISAVARGTYLQWLSGGRRDQRVQLGFVFLFFYGLERRVLHDLQKDREVVSRELPFILAEVRRLLSIYGGNGSFYRYANEFVDLLVTVGARDRLYRLPAPSPGPHRALTVRHKVALGQVAVDGATLPPEWAFSWLMNDERVSLRTPAKRCAEEFKKLFLFAYAEKFGEGIKLPVNKTKLKMLYRPASASFNHGHIQFAEVDLPDITVVEGPLNKLRDIAEQAIEQLGSYSRFIGRNPEKKGSADAITFLPPQLWPDENIRTLKEWLVKLGADHGPACATFGELYSHFPGLAPTKKDQSAVFAAGLEELGVGIEPDVRWGGGTPDQDTKVVLFPLVSGKKNGKPSVQYRIAALTLHLAAAVIAADGEVSATEKKHLEELLNRWLRLDPPEQDRLRAHLTWLIVAPPSLSALKKRVSDLSEEQKRAIAALLINIAQAEGGVSASEIKVLSKIYRLFGFEEKALYGDVHTVATEEPVTVKRGRAEESGFGVPPKPVPKLEPGITLDHNRIAALHVDTQRISALLGAIFVEEEPPDSEADGEDEALPPANSLAGLDAVLSELARVLLSRDSWERAELEDLAADHGIMLDGALEQINEAFFDKYNEPLLEGEGAMEINRNITRELHAA